MLEFIKFFIGRGIVKKLMVFLLVLNCNFIFAETFQNVILNEVREELILNKYEGEVLDLEMESIQVRFPLKNIQNVDKRCHYKLSSETKNLNYQTNATEYRSILETITNQCFANESFQFKNSERDVVWNFSVHFGFNLTHYRPTDIKMQSSRLNISITDFELIQRTSAKYYNPQNWVHFQDYFKWIDEPTNSIVITAEANDHEIILSVFHPKFEIAKGQSKYVTGVIDGVEINGVIDIEEPFDDYNNQPGEMHLVRFENTHLQMEYTIGYGYKFKIFDNRFGELTIRPAIYLGVMAGQNNTVYLKQGEYWEYDHYVQNHAIQAPVVGVGAKVNYRNGRFNLFVESKYNTAFMNHKFMDGTTQYTLNYIPTTMGVGITLFNKPKKKIPSF
jgi:hypothetical protein